MDVLYTIQVSLIPRLRVISSAWWKLICILFISYLILEEADDPNVDSSTEDSPLVAISSITVGGIIMGFVVAFVAYKLCKNRRNADEPVVGGNSFIFTVFC